MSIDLLSSNVSRSLPSKLPPPSALESWRPEHLWLAEDCWHPETLRRMSAAVQAAIEIELAPTAPVSEARERLAILWRADRKSVETLRQAARVMRTYELHPAQIGCNLVATALFLSGTRCLGMVAAIEFGFEVSQRITALLAARSNEALPPGVVSATQLAERMKGKVAEVLSFSFGLPWLQLEPITSHLSRALAEDPLVRLERDGTYDPTLPFGAIMVGNGSRRGHGISASPAGVMGH